MRKLVLSIITTAFLATPLATFSVAAGERQMSPEEAIGLFLGTVITLKSLTDDDHHHHYYGDHDPYPYGYYEPQPRRHRHYDYHYGYHKPNRRMRERCRWERSRAIKDHGGQILGWDRIWVCR